MSLYTDLLFRINELARTIGDSVQLRGFKAGGTAGQVPVKGAGGDFDWSWGSVGSASVAWGDVTDKPLVFTPDLHKSTHATGGTDALVPSDIGALEATGGTLTNGTISGTLAAGVLTTDATTKTNLRNAVGLGTADAVQHAAITGTTGTFSGFVTGSAYVSSGSSFTVPAAQAVGQWGGSLAMFSGGALVATYALGRINHNSTVEIAWASDTLIARKSAGIVKFGASSNHSWEATNGTLLGNLTVSGIIYTALYTVGTLPTATAQGIIYVSDESGGATIAFSDGTNWRRVSDRAIVS